VGQLYAGPMKSVIEEFYSAFSIQDGEAMTRHYHENVVFEDPAFGKLEGKRASAMWKMLCESQKGKDFKVRVSEIQSDGKMGSAKWEADYTFSKTGRKVHNVIYAQFDFDGDKIMNHRDSFNLHKWSKQAFGMTGFLLGWTPAFKNKLQVQTNSMLDRYMK
jgi:limonene-1,2-epoxide hydrolase